MNKKMQDFLNRKNCFFIHYASDGFYDGTVPSPRISCISVYDEKRSQVINFSLDDFWRTSSVPKAEKILLADFKAFLEANSDICFIHWNMGAKGFGFTPIWARAKELGIDLPKIREENLFDLSYYVAYLSEKRLSIKQILWFNSLLDREYLDGREEALYFEKHKFSEIRASVNLKVVGLSCIVEEIRKGTLKTEKIFAKSNDGLTKEERRHQALKLAEAREKMIRDIYEHNKRIMSKSEKVLDEDENCTQGNNERYRFLFFDFDHPFASLFANWFINL